MIEFLQLAGWAMLGLLAYLSAIVILPVMGVGLLLCGMAAYFRITEDREGKT